MQCFHKAFKRHRQTLQTNPAIKLQRISENHAKIMAFADCLPLVAPVTKADIKQIHSDLEAMAETRQQALNQDHPVVQQFWSIFDYLNSRPVYMPNQMDPNIDNDLLNHSNNPTAEIAVNLEHFNQRCIEMKQETIPSKELRKHLPTSRKRKFLRNEVVKSRIEKRSVRCWVFGVA